MNRELAGLLQFYRAVGITELYVPPEMRERLRDGPVPHKDPRQNALGLPALYQEWAGCAKCRLSQSRTHLVFGEGNENAKLMFIGEGPGRDEDFLGRPFVGRAGELLTRIMAAMKLRREQVYITNVVKCRPPRNRTPLPDEIETCRPCLQGQIEIIGPKVICALGAVAAQSLLGTDAPITALRGRFHTAGEIRIMPTYHPAYLLRNPTRKREVWEDVQQVLRELDLKDSSQTEDRT